MTRHGKLGSAVLLAAASVALNAGAAGYSWRGLMLDESRFFFGKQVVKETLDQMAACGLNVFHWHLTDDQGWRLEIKGYPELTAVGAVRAASPKVHTDNDLDGKPYGPFFYTEADVREILAYAAARNIRVVPEIELPGHIGAFLRAHPEFSCTGRIAPDAFCRMNIYDDVLCVGNDAAIRCLERVLDEVCRMFPDEVIHIGGDECPTVRWQACPKCRARMKAEGLSKPRALQSWVTHHFARHLEKKGRRAMAWDEVVEGGGCPTSVIVQSWRTPELYEEKGAEAAAVRAARLGHDVVFSPMKRVYFSVPEGPDDLGEYRSLVKDYSWYIPREVVRSYRPDAGFPEELKSRILGAECCCWSEGTRTGPVLHQKTWPRAAVFAGALAAAGRSVGYKPADWNLAARRKFSDQRFGIFIHWGLYANYAQGEWYLQQANGGAGVLAERDYARMMYGFYPSKFDARAWARTFRQAGAKYVTITSRHHDGFSLWPTKADDGYNVAHTPFKRDILGELAEACAAEGLQLNFYYSLMDWHRKDYPPGDCAKRVLHDQKGDYASYKKFMMDQISELIDSYHPGNIWFDGEWEHARCQPDGAWKETLDWEFDDIYDLIHSKKTLVANNNHRPIRAKEDIQLFERDLPGDNSDAGFSVNQPVTNDRPIEQCDVIQDNVWGYKIAEWKFRTAEDVVAMVARAAAKDSNLLMNIGPNGAGELPAQAVEAMEKVGGWFAKNGESIYGTRAGGISAGKGVVSTRKGEVLYLHFLDAATGKIAFRADCEVAAATSLDGASEVGFERTPSGDTVVTVKRSAGNSFDCVVKVTFK